MTYLIGLDCGGTRTRGVLTDENLRVRARAAGGPGNPLSAGMLAARRSYKTVIRSLLRGAQLQPRNIAALAIGAAGAGRQTVRRRIKRALRTLLPKARITVDTDGMIALLGATRGNSGIIVIAGTGSFVLCTGSDGRRERGGGWGPILGDEGSGAAMGREALQAMLRAEDGREPPTRLKPALLRHFEVQSIDALVVRIYRRPPGPRELARLWPMIARLAQSGDPVARKIAVRGGTELAYTVEAAARKARLTGKRIPLILTGGILSRSSLLRDTLLARLKKTLPRAHMLRPEASPQIGAAYLALQSLREESRSRRG